MPGTAEPPAQESAMTPIGEVFNKAMSDAGDSNAAPESNPAPQEPKKKSVKPEPKPTPKTALDAALGGDEPEKPEPVVEDDPLKEFGEEAKPGHWKKAKEKIARLDGELKELRNRKIEADPALTTELATVKAQLKERETILAEREAKLSEYNDAMTAINIELHPDFRREFIDGRNELAQSAAEKLKSYGGKSESLIEALSMPEGRRRDEAVEEALGDLSDPAKAKILRTVAEIESLDERRSKAMKAPQQSYEELERRTATQRQKQAAEAEQIKTAEFERITRDIHKTVPTLALVDESMDGGKEWNASVKQAREDAFKLFGADATFPDMVTTAIKGRDYDRITKMLVAERKETATLRAQLAQFDGALPDMKGRDKKPSASDAAMEKTPGAIYSETMARLSGGDGF